MFHVIGWVCVLTALCSCLHSKEFLIKDQQAEAVFSKLLSILLKKIPQVGHDEFLDFEFMAAKPENLKLVLYYSR